MTAFSINFDMVQAFNAAVTESEKKNQRLGFVNGLIETFKNSTDNDEYNILIFNLNQNYDEHLEGIKSFQTVTLGTVTYGIWIFTHGYFRNKGSLGDENWRSYSYALIEEDGHLRRYFKCDAEKQQWKRDHPPKDHPSKNDCILM
jgi:hypothetical protein